MQILTKKHSRLSRIPLKFKKNNPLIPNKNKIQLLKK